MEIDVQKVRTRLEAKQTELQYEIAALLDEEASLGQSDLGVEDTGDTAQVLQDVRQDESFNIKKGIEHIPVRKLNIMFESKTPFESKTFKRAYLIGSVIVWVSILIGTAVILSGTPYFAQILPILFVGVIWFILLLPSAYFWTRPKSDQPSPTK